MTRQFCVAVLLAIVVGVPINQQALAAPASEAEKQDDKIRPGDRLYLEVIATLLGQDIKGVYRVEQSGAVPLGPAYGRVKLSNLTLEKAEDRVRDHLQKVVHNPEVSVTRYDSVAHSAHGGTTLESRIAKLEKELGELRAMVEQLGQP